MKRGHYIVLQGIQGSGKTTQIDLLNQHLQKKKVSTRIMREPDSQTDLTARTIRQMTQSPHYPMNTRTEVMLYNAARSQTLDIVEDMRSRGVTCLLDHSYLTTYAVQFYGRGDITDYEALNTIIKFTVGDVEPDLMIIIDIPVKVARERLKQRSGGEKFDNLSADFLTRERDGLLKEAKKRNLPIVDGTLSVDALSKQITKLVDKKLKQPTQAKATQVAPATKLGDIIETKKNPFVSKHNDQFKISDSGQAYLDKAVTDSSGNVYAFTGELDNATIAAAMARLSRRGDDMRITLLDEFAVGGSKDEALLNRVITAYGDDSVQQLSGLHFVVENASNLLSKLLEWGRLAAYLEQSTRYIYFDQKDSKGNYKYFTPPNLDAKTAQTYEKTIDIIFDLYSRMVRQLTDYIRAQSDVPTKDQDGAWKAATRAQACDAIRAVLPVATKSTVGVYASAQATESLIMHLLADDLQEAREVGQALLKQVRKVTPVFFERADKPDRGGATTAYMANTRKNMKQIADKQLEQTLSPLTDDVNLVDYWPRRELDLLPHMLFEHTDLPLEEITKQVTDWSYNDKLKAFNTYMGERLNRRHKPGRALENAHYSWEIVCDYGIFRDLQRHRIVDDLRWQKLSPRFGFEMPELVEEAGLATEFERCFDLSNELYSTMQAAGYELEAQYATLLGHKMRWKITYNAREAFHFHELRTSPQGHPGYRKLVKKMHDTVAEVHPILADAMIFVNRDEDPALTRLAAERYTQYKLKILDTKK